MEIEEEEVSSKENLFSYKQLAKILVFGEDGFCDFNKISGAYKSEAYNVSRPKENGFYTITKKSEPDISRDKGKFFNSDLKFHLSLPEDDSKVDPSLPQESRSFYERGWDIIQTILRKNEVSYFKITANECRMSQSINTPHQQGKDVTIYAAENPEYDEGDWIRIISEITTALVNEDIPPGYRTSNQGERIDKRLIGNNYVSYRYEKAEPKVDIFANSRIINRFNWPANQLPNIKFEGEPEINDQHNQEDDTSWCCKIS